MSTPESNYELHVRLSAKAKEQRVSAPVTEAHRDEATRWIASRPSNVSRQIDSLAQAFADSEAAAAPIDKELQNERRLHAATVSERDQLRAECEHGRQAIKIFL